MIWEIQERKQIFRYLGVTISITQSDEIPEECVMDVRIDAIPFAGLSARPFMARGEDHARAVAIHILRKAVAAELQVLDRICDAIEHTGI